MIARLFWISTKKLHQGARAAGDDGAERHADGHGQAEADDLERQGAVEQVGRHPMVAQAAEHRAAQHAEPGPDRRPDWVAREPSGACRSQQNESGAAQIHAEIAQRPHVGRLELGRQFKPGVTPGKENPEQINGRLRTREQAQNPGERHEPGAEKHDGEKHVDEGGDHPLVLLATLVESDEGDAKPLESHGRDKGHDDQGEAVDPIAANIEQTCQDRRCHHAEQPGQDPGDHVEKAVADQHAPWSWRPLRRPAWPESARSRWRSCIGNSQKATNRRSCMAVGRPRPTLRRSSSGKAP